MLWSSRPFIRILIFYAAGLLLAFNSAFVKSIQPAFIVGCIIVLLVITIVLYSLKTGWQFRWAGGLTIGIAIFLTAIYFANLRFDKTNVNLPSGDHTFIGVVVKQPSSSEQSVKTVLKINEVVDTSIAIPDPIYVMVYLEKGSLSNNLIYGDHLVFDCKLAGPKRPANPGEFDYGKYLLRNGIVATAYLQNSKWKKLTNNPENKIIAIAIKLRQKLLLELQKNGLSNKEYSVAAAVLLGYDDLMDDEIQKDYIVAGAVHILCVSGMHVGIVYLVLNFILGLFLKRKFLAILIKTVLLLTFVWAYALLTGFAPSVWRASLMISIFIVGDTLNRNREPFNTLAAAAVIMLVINPMILLNLGFQLSYAAVLGILIFYRPIYNLIYIKNKLFNKIWAVVVVSTAAQLGTFPLAAHYFHYLPTYFWLTNILIFPLSFAIIGAGIIFIFLFWVPILGNSLGLIIAGFVYLMNQVVGLVRHLPANGVDYLYFPWIKVLFIYALIIALFNLLLFKNLKYLLPVSVLIFLLLGYQTYRKYDLLKQEKLIIYSISKSNAINFVRGTHYFLLADSVLRADADKIDYHIKPGFISMGLGEVKVNQTIDESLNLFFDGQFGDYLGYRFLVLSNKTDWLPMKEKLRIDALVVEGNKVLNMENLTACLDFKVLVIDNSVPYWKRKKLISFAEEHSIQYYDIATEGVFLKDFRN